MLYLRFIGISLVKWIAMLLFVTVFAGYLAPSWLRGYGLAAVIWLFTTGVAYGFAYWALHVTSPTRKRVIALIGIWMAITIVLEFGYEFFTIGAPIFLMGSLDIYVQYALELLSILAAARMIRVNQLRSVAHEGLVR